MNYRRIFVQNAYLHIIILAYKRKKIFTDNIELLQHAFENAKKYFSFEIVTICVLPDHIHFILKPAKINEYPRIITSIKYYFSRNYVGVETPTYDTTEVQECKLGFQPNKRKENFQPKNLTHGYINKGEKGLFQRRYYEHTITSQEELNNHINYIHYNPVKHRYADKVKNWKYSSFHKFVKNGFYDGNWCDFSKVKDMNYE